MTLHLTRVSRRYALQVSDRLVSGGVRDSVANKNIIYWARDAVVTMGYSGLAYGLSEDDPDQTTDDWIAETLCGGKLAKGDPEHPTVFASGKISKWLDIGQSMELLSQRLTAALGRIAERKRIYPFELVAAGWQRIGRRAKPVVVELIKPSGEAVPRLHRPDRNSWPACNEVLLLENPSNVLAKQDQAGIEWRSAMPDKAERWLVDCIRRASARHPQTVGPHCMSILVPAGGWKPIRVRFIPQAIHRAGFGEDGRVKWIRAVGFSPWIVGPRGFCAPSIHVGDSKYIQSPFEVVIEAPPLPKDVHGVLGYTGAQRRPRGP
jgi:hypothetical protein